MVSTCLKNIKSTKMKNYIIYILLGTALVFGACEYDNYEEPQAILYGQVVYDGQAVGVRTNGPQLELWQDGYELSKNIPIFIAQDGTYSVSLFDGEYKLVRKAGAPWLAELSDTIIVNVNGHTEFDVPVTPYFSLHDETYQAGNNTVSVTFNIDQVVDAAAIQEVNLYLGYSVLTDQNKNEHIAGADISNITLGGQNNIQATIPEHLQDEEYLFVRVGVRSNMSGEFSYTEVQKLDI